LRGEAIRIVGWDIGGVNVKASLVDTGQSFPEPVRTVSRSFEIWREKDRLQEVLREVFAEIASGKRPDAMAVTMSAELSDVFETKREGVLFVLECVSAAFPGVACHCLTVSGNFVPLERARLSPLDFAAANWVASAQWVALKHPNCLLLDIGSTTTDILPILNGRVRVRGRTDTERLISGELVYTGALRTNLAAVVHSVPVHGRYCRVSSEYFAVSGDVHLILGHIRPEDYTCTTPDNRPPTVDSASKRLARLVCADAEMMAQSEVDALAQYIYDRQILQIRSGLEQVLSELPELRDCAVMVHGIGAFLGNAAAESIGLKIERMTEELSAGASAILPCVAAAYLLASTTGEK